MSVKIGINGFGTHRPQLLPGRQAAGRGLDFVAVNDITDAKTWRTCSSTTRSSGGSPARSRCRQAASSVDGDELEVLAERDPATCPGGSSASTS